MNKIIKILIGLFCIALLANAAAAKTDVMPFLEEDTTEQNILSDEYTSKDFANTLIQNADKEGIEAHKLKVSFYCRSSLYLVAFEDGTVVNPCGTKQGSGIDKIVDGTIEVGKKIDIYTLTGCEKNYDLPEVKKINWLNVPEEWR